MSLQTRFRTEFSDRRSLLYTAVVANTLLLLALVYGVLNGRPPTVYWVFPIVWITIGTWAVFHTSSVSADTRTRATAGAIAFAYFLLLAFVGGLFGPASGPETGLTVQVTALPPGWNPAILYGGAFVQFAIVPFSAFGYAVLAYLVYITALEAEGAAAGGLLGLFSCVSCTLPVIASLLGGFAGGVAMTAARTQSYAIGTAVFVVTVVLLLYRPGFGRIQRWLARSR